MLFSPKECAGVSFIGILCFLKEPKWIEKPALLMATTNLSAQILGIERTGTKLPFSELLVQYDKATSLFVIEFNLNLYSIKKQQHVY